MQVGIWGLNAIILLATAVSTLCWGFSLTSVGDVTLSLGGLMKIALNPWFVGAVGTSLVSALFSFYIKKILGIAAGQLFLTLPAVVAVAIGYAIFGNKLSSVQILGMLMIVIGTTLVGSS